MPLIPNFIYLVIQNMNSVLKPAPFMAHKKITDKNIFAMLTYKFFLHLKSAHADMDFKQQDMNKPPQETADAFLAKTEDLCHQTYTFIHMTHSCLVPYQHCSDTSHLDP